MRRGLYILIILFLLFLFVTKTSRGGSLILYAVNGSGAPFAVKTACIQQTESNVKQKFANPPDFPWRALDALKSFWYYSYLTECYYEHGYTFPGDDVAASEIIERDGESLYMNGIASFEMNMPATTIILVNNKLDVDYHHKLYESRLEMDGATVSLHVYDYTNYPEEIEKILDNETQLSRTTGEVTLYESFEREDGSTIIRVRQTDGNDGSIIILESGFVLHIYGGSETIGIMESMITTLAHTK